MKINLPVTQNELVLRDDTMIVSKTDLKGLITYVNKDFVLTSGYTEAELIGQSHNIVRHPEMPEEAFRDLWSTLQQGRPWVGCVKNRCKNGDYYWVLASVAPILENGSHVGYISVRRKASAQAVAAAEAAYKKFRDKQAGNLVIKYGQVVSRRRFSFGDISIATKMFAAILMVVLICGLAILTSWSGMQEVHRSFTAFNEREQKLLDTYFDMYSQGLQMVVALRNTVLDPNDRAAFDNFEKAKIDFRQQLEVAKMVPDPARQFSAQLEQIASKSVEMIAAHDKVIRLVNAGDLAQAKAAMVAEDTPLWRDSKKVILEARKAMLERAIEQRGEIGALVVSAGRMSLLFGLVALVAATLTAWLLVQAIRRPLSQMNDTFANILRGNYGNQIDTARSDEIGKALQGLQVLQTRLGFELAEITRQAEEMTRIKVALDSAAMPVTISDSYHALVYMNSAARALWSELAPELARKRPGFTVDSMFGRGIAEYFDEEEARQAFRAELVQPRTMEIAICGKTIRATAAPVRDSAGQYLARATQWLDRTVELGIEREIQEIVAAAARGDFARRLTLDGKNGFSLILAQELNRLLDTTVGGLNDVAAVLADLAQGDLTKSITADYLGTFGQLKEDTNATVARLRDVVGHIKEATEAINTAAQEIAAGNQDLSSRTEEQASSLEETASSMEELNATVKQNADNARQANELAKQANDGVTRGSQVVKRVIVTMGEIQDSARKIADIIGVIDSIAFQTNILALNAAVEAARAGEQGRGFAVVATEVRNLAQRSATAAKEIKALIAESVSKVENGTQQVGEAGSAMDEVVSSFRSVAAFVTEISAASKEQSSGIEQVTKAVSQMDEVTQQNAALVEQAAAAAESLEEQVRGLVEVVSIFRLSMSSGSHLPGPGLHDITPKQLGRHGKPMPSLTASVATKPPKKIAPAHLADTQDDWEEF